MHDRAVIDADAALERALATGDDAQSWRALRLSGDEPPEIPPLHPSEPSGAVLGPSGRPSPGATGATLCHMKVLGLERSGPAVAAMEWLVAARTPAFAWLDAPDDVPGDLDTPAGGRVWATASATCALLAVGSDPGPRAVDLLRGEADLHGRFTGGAYPTFAAAGAYWQAEGARTEMAEWALRWAREAVEDWDAAELSTALTFWGAAGITADHASVDAFLDRLRDVAPEAGWADDLDLTLLALELSAYFER